MARLLRLGKTRRRLYDVLAPTMMRAASPISAAGLSRPRLFPRPCVDIAALLRRIVWQLLRCRFLSQIVEADMAKPHRRVFKRL